VPTDRVGEASAEFGGSDSLCSSRASVRNHPAFWILLAGVVAPLLGEIPLGFRVPIVVFEVVLGIVVGPHVLGLVQFDGIVEMLRNYGMALTLFMAGMELDFHRIQGRPLTLAAGGWSLSVLAGISVVGLLHVVPGVHAPMMVTLALCTTGLGVLIPVFRDGGQLETPFGRLFMAAGTFGEVGPIVAMSLLLSTRYSTWQEFGFLLVFLLVVGVAAAVGLGARPPKVLELLGRTMHSSTQLPVRTSLLLLATLAVLAEEFGFESIFGAFAAGMVIGQITRGEDAKPLREKLDAVAFGWFYPFFFVGTGIKFDVAALGKDLATMLLVPTFLALFLIVRGLPVLLYRNDITKAQRLPFALSSAVPSLSITIVITGVGTTMGVMNPDVAAALVGAALLSVLLFPTIAGAMLGKGAIEPQTHAPT
jgi:Kef-type K+ transport system membrane component KefB